MGDPASSWPMNRPATWTAAPAATPCGCWPSRTPRAGRLLLVTHDRAVAEQAEYTLHMRDGRLPHDLVNVLRTALSGIAANKLRTGLTMLGIIIGVASVIATPALGNGARAAVENSFRFLGQ